MDQGLGMVAYASFRNYDHEYCLFTPHGKRKHREGGSVSKINYEEDACHQANLQLEIPSVYLCKSFQHYYKPKNGICSKCYAFGSENERKSFLELGNIVLQHN
jgi:hypothetical protein